MKTLNKTSILERRISRLEKLVKESMCKTESRYADPIMQEMEDDLMSGEGMDYDEWMETLEDAVNGELDGVVEQYAEEHGLSEAKVRRMLKTVAKKCLKDIEDGLVELPEFDDDDWD